MLSTEHLMLEVVAEFKAYFGEVSHVLIDFTSSSISSRCGVGKPPLLRLCVAVELFMLLLCQENLVIVNLQVLIVWV